MCVANSECWYELPDVKGGTGDEAPERRELVMLFWRLRLSDWVVESWRGSVPRVRSDVEGA